MDGAPLHESCDVPAVHALPLNVCHSGRAEFDAVRDHSADALFRLPGEGEERMKSQRGGVFAPGLFRVPQDMRMKAAPCIPLRRGPPEAVSLLQRRWTFCIGGEALRGR
eukprot:291523-Chlamydomonas_euryale.AAC.1